MNKKEILSRAKKENLLNDEAKNYKGRKGNAWGLLAAMLVWLIFTTIYFLKGRDTYHLFAISFAHLGFTYLGKYYANKERSDLLLAIGGLLVFIGNFIVGLIEIWNF